MFSSALKSESSSLKGQHILSLTLSPKTKHFLNGEEVHESGQKKKKKKIMKRLIQALRETLAFNL